MGNGYPETLSVLKRTVGMVSAFLILIGVAGCDRGTGLEPARNNAPALNVQATIAAYNTLNELINSEVHEPDWSLASQGKFDELATAATQQSKEILSIGVAISQMETNGVDAEVTSLAVTFSEFFAVMAGNIHRRAEIAQSLKAFDRNHKSAAALVEAFLRGAKGDPFGKAYEQLDDWQKIEKALVQNRTQAQQIEQVAARLGERNAALKEYLQRTYGVK